MNCTTVRGRLLGCEQPAQPPPELHLHLARCPACRAWQRRLARAEQQVARLPVPPSAGPARAVEQILRAPPPAPRPAPRPLVRPNPVSPGLAPRERGQQKLALALALAAALATFALGWWAWPHPSGSGPGVYPDPFAARLQHLDRRILAAHTPRERVRIVADEVDQLQREIRGHVNDPRGLERYSRYYVEVVQERLLVEARALPAEERPTLQEIAGRLRRAESEASRLAAEAPVASARPLHRMATAAAEGNRRLRALLDERS